jgi:hypothetical protein
MSPYKISGSERRKLKKELSELKYFVKMFWHYEDIDRVYGGGLTDKECDDLIFKKNKEIEDLELLLSEPSTQIKRDLKIEELGI